MDLTLELLSYATIALGSRMREFQGKTCMAFATHELERERAARMRHQGKNVATTKIKTNTQKGSSVRRPKRFNLRTYKYHALGDYCNAIQQFGTTDSYSTQPVRSFFLISLSDRLPMTPVQIRANVNIEPQKGGFFGLAAG